MIETLQVEARGDLLIVTESNTEFVAIYVKPEFQPQLMLMRYSPPMTAFSSRKPARRLTTRRASSGGSCKGLGFGRHPRLYGGELQRRYSNGEAIAVRFSS